MQNPDTTHEILPKGSFNIDMGGKVVSMAYEMRFAKDGKFLPYINSNGLLSNLLGVALDFRSSPYEFLLGVYKGLGNLYKQLGINQEVNAVAVKLLNSEETIFFCMDSIATIFSRLQKYDSPKAAGKIGSLLTLSEDEHNVGIVFRNGGEDHRISRKIINGALNDSYEIRAHLTSIMDSEMPGIIDGFVGESYIDAQQHIQEGIGIVTGKFILGEYFDEGEYLELLKQFNLGLNLGFAQSMLPFGFLSGPFALFFKKNVDRMKENVKEEIESLKSNGPKNTVISYVVNMFSKQPYLIEDVEERIERISAEILNLLFASYDTTSGVITSIIKELTNENVFDYVASRYEEDSKGTVHDLMIAGLAKWGSTQLTKRRLLEDDVVDGVELESGKEVMLPLLIALRQYFGNIDTDSDIKMFMELDNSGKEKVIDFIFGTTGVGDSLDKRYCLGKGVAMKIILRFLTLFLQKVKSLKQDPSRIQKLGTEATLHWKNVSVQGGEA